MLLAVTLIVEHSSNQNDSIFSAETDKSLLLCLLMLSEVEKVLLFDIIYYKLFPSGNQRRILLLFKKCSFLGQGYSNRAKERKMLDFIRECLTLRHFQSAAPEFSIHQIASDIIIGYILIQLISFELRGAYNLITMKNNKINFFQSPNPTHFNLNNLRQIQYRNPEEHELPQQRLFSTPLRLNTQITTSPTFNVNPYFSHPDRLQRRRESEELSQFPEEYMDIQQPIQESYHAIQQKLEFSEPEQQEDLLIPITPIKNMIKVEQEVIEQSITVRKNPQIFHTPSVENRMAERGLKKLAAQAHRFVTQQKRTTYKEVARKLISQLNDEMNIDANVDQSDHQRRGQMNIKRRVYDALNVLIALGILKRNGNKIYGRKLEMEEPICNKTVEKERQRMRQKQMENELTYLKMQYERKQILFNAKKKLHKDLKVKTQKCKELIKKNMKPSNSKQCSKIQFPMIVLCRKETNQVQIKEQKMLTQVKQEQQCLKVWQEKPDTFHCYFNCAKKMQIMGQLDMLTHLSMEETAKQPPKLERTKRKGR